MFILRKQVLKIFFFALNSQLSCVFKSVLDRSVISAKLLWYLQSGHSLAQ